MWNEPSQQRLEKIPRLYSTEDIELKDKHIYLHFFIAGCDWYAAEFDGQERFFGFVILNNDFEMAEWGYFSFNELKSIKLENGIEIDCESELAFKIQPVSHIQRIRDAQNSKKIPFFLP